MSTADKAGKQYWDSVWEGAALPSPIDPHNTALDNWANQQFHRHFARMFPKLGIVPGTSDLLEIGCARSQWLPYFAQQFGFRIHGLDYSEIGCEQSRQMLAAANLSGDIALADFFAPPAEMLDKFDVVTSFGVAEHFTDTAACIGAFAKFLKPGGTMITIIPNMPGIVGMVQKRVNRAVYDVHVPLTRRALTRAHEAAGLQIRDSRHLMFVNMAVVNMENWATRKRLYWLLTRAIWWPNKLAWLVERLLPIFPPNAITSPYIVCTATRPA